MPYDKDGNLLWIADETGAHEVLKPGEGYNGRTREPGEPDWWVVAKPPDWRPSGSAGGKADTDGGLAGGGGEFSGSGATSGYGPGKLAGADNETDNAGYNAAGQPKAPAEPWTLFSAGQEHLDHIDRKNGFGDAVSTIGSGIGEAVSKGAQGAGEALGKTWDALTTNTDLHKGVEFGAKAAWEVSKDVGKRVVEDAGDAYLGYLLGNKSADPKYTDPLGKVGDLYAKGVKLHDQAPEWGRSLGTRLNKIKQDVYSKE